MVEMEGLGSRMCVTELTSHVWMAWFELRALGSRMCCKAHVTGVDGWLKLGDFRV